MAALAEETPPQQVRLSEAKDRERTRLNSDAAEHYRIGEPGVPWGAAEKAAWLAQTSVKRSYLEEVGRKMDALDASLFEVRRYGSLSLSPERYPLLAAVSRSWDAAKPCVLVTGGVHGYETSGVQGALLFLATRARDYLERFNVLVCPCVSPWGYENVERWNCKCLDPNRSFSRTDAAAQTEESAAVIALLESLEPAAGAKEGGAAGLKWVCHVDCHETTDTDESEYMPARAALNGAAYKPCDIPDGFYLVGDSEKPETVPFHEAIIACVREVTHIAPADANGTIIEEPVVSEGILLVPADQLCLCSSVTGAALATTTEVYPDSLRPGCTDEQCNRAQVAAIVGALDFVLAEVLDDDGDGGGDGGGDGDAAAPDYAALSALGLGDGALAALREHMDTAGEDGGGGGGGGGGGSGLPAPIGGRHADEDPLAPPDGTATTTTLLGSSSSSSSSSSDGPKGAEVTSNIDFKLKSYWDRRFDVEDEYEWLADFSAVRPHLEALLPPPTGTTTTTTTTTTTKKKTTTTQRQQPRIRGGGCGNSRFSAELHAAGWADVTSSDFSEVCIEAMREKHRGSGPGLTWVVADMLRLEESFPEGEFDFVLDKAAMDALMCDEGELEGRR